MVKVKELIAELKKMPQDAVVVFKDHDHSPDEFNNEVEWVEECEELYDRFRNDVVALKG